jgi:hypothetical protein
MIIQTLLVLSLILSPGPQTPERRDQIKDLIGKSDLVVVAIGDSYRPVVDKVKYRQERQRDPGLDPSRMQKYMLGVAYQMTVREVIYLKPQKDETKQITWHVGDPIPVYAPGPLSDPREFGKPSFLPGVEYLLFLKRTELDPSDFPNAVEQASDAPMNKWPVFPDTRLAYVTPLRDSFAFLPLEGAWKNFLVQTRAVVKELQEKARQNSK